MNNIEQNLHDVRNRITVAAQKCGRTSEEITLLAVSKTRPAEDIAKAIASGQREFGENYVQEGVDKIQHFINHDDLVWHFIGPLQSNKSRLVAENFDWCHTIDRLKIAQRLNEQRPEQIAPLNVLIQINISGEESKSGILLEELTEFATTINAMPNLVLRGLMAIPAPESDFERQIAVFRQMEQALIELKTQYSQVDTLSMGMTNDMEAAITCGSTLVRIGTAIFGARKYDT
ncbi:YggS family pyridoxal phosphate-dependent enzyme [Xenorhabdus hominickii]|uniref:Pyridoxal phosphate homeostasis protein n=1 Tax=Xenorhabdus hominickii TaxID=351679 RepID=A0A2G0QA15_XENHO|nr:YggS family pyridoxal phosphate-dependent enzyme [Xenorhabdus hominickii]AOM40970.1 YggS family pyridoxal phosphate enzyme [Xenorhabdus hominickii]PHM56053.1 YggS family pyridoxal phosphate enzyme [Xenorhabdus hominickii]